MKLLRPVILAFLLIGCMSYAMAQANIPKLEQRVNDFTNTLSYQEWQAVDNMLKGFEDSASIQIVVLMVNSLEGVGIDDYARNTFEANKIGQAKKDKGVLLVISKQDRKVKIEAGRGVENVLTDPVSSQIIRHEIAPHLVAVNYFGGIATGVDAIMRAATGDYCLAAPAKKPILWLVIMHTVFAGCFIIMIIVLLVTLEKALKRCSPENRAMTPASVWFFIIPIFNFVWQFIIVTRVDSSLENEFKRRNLLNQQGYGKRIGLAWCILYLCYGLFFLFNIAFKIPLISDSNTDIIGIVILFTELICLFLYWREIENNSVKIALPFNKE